jgi:chitinase
MSRLIRSGWLALAFAFSVGAVETQAAQAKDDSGYRVIGYVSDGEKLPPISARKLDVINFAFAHVNPQHEVFLPRETAARSLAGLTALRKDNPDLKIVLSIGGWGAGNFSEAAATEAARARFADTAVELVRRHDLDGVDVDWEYPGHPGPGISYSADDKANFPLMLEAVRTKLDALGKTQGDRYYLLTIAAADGDAARGLDIPRISAILDWINLMTYDFYGSLKRTTGHHAGLRPSRTAEPGSRNTVQAVEEFLAGGTPPRKLHVGLAFYGRTFDEVTDGNNFLAGDRPFTAEQGRLRPPLGRAGAGGVAVESDAAQDDQLRGSAGAESQGGLRAREGPGRRDVLGAEQRPGRAAAGCDPRSPVHRHARETLNRGNAFLRERRESRWQFPEPFRRKASRLTSLPQGKGLVWHAARCRNHPCRSDVSRDRGFRSRCAGRRRDSRRSYKQRLFSRSAAWTAERAFPQNFIVNSAPTVRGSLMNPVRLLKSIAPTMRVWSVMLRPNSATS